MSENKILTLKYAKLIYLQFLTELECVFSIENVTSVCCTYEGSKMSNSVSGCVTSLNFPKLLYTKIT